MNTPSATRIALVGLLVLMVGCTSSAGEDAVETLAAETEVDPTAAATPEPTAKPTAEPSPTAEVAQNCMDPELYARLTDQTLASTPAAPEEAAELAAALRAYDFSDLDLPESVPSYIDSQILQLEQSGTVAPEFILTLLSGQIPITTC